MQIGTAALGQPVAIPSVSGGGMQLITVHAEYNAASGNLCRRYSEQSSPLVMRVVCKDDDGQWYQQRQLLSTAAESTPSAIAQNQLHGVDLQLQTAAVLAQQQAIEVETTPVVELENVQQDFDATNATPYQATPEAWTAADKIDQDFPGVNTLPAAVQVATTEAAAGDSLWLPSDTAATGQSEAGEFVVMQASYPGEFLHAELTADETAVSGAVDSADTLDSVEHFELEAGETLWKFSRRTTGRASNWEKIAQINSISDVELMRSGDELLVPTSLVRRSLLAD